MAYLNNIIIYLNSKKEYKKHIKWVLKRLYKENIPIIVKKYKFYIRKTNFIKFIIKPGQISINLKKIQAIVKWQDLKIITGLRLFLSFYNYYKQFIINWSEETELFIKIIKKNKP